MFCEFKYETELNIHTYIHFYLITRVSFGYNTVDVDLQRKV